MKSVPVVTPSMKPMVYGSVCSGIEAATAAWHPLGWRPAFFSEIDPMPCALLKHHYPDVPLHGDFTTIKENDYEPIDLLVGGTPCQDFSVAGLRKGVVGDRGNLTLEFLRLAQRLRPTWIVWENVPGVLSNLSHHAPDPVPPPNDMAIGSEWVGEDEYESDERHAFSCFMAGLSEIGYGAAYRILDAQYFGVAQQRRRVFVVGYLGNWRPPAAVLFESESLSGNPAPSRKKGERRYRNPSACAKGGGGLGTDFECLGGLQIAPTLDARSGRSGSNNFATSGGQIAVAFESRIARNGRGQPKDICPPLKARSGDTGKGDSAPLVAYGISPDAFDRSGEGAGGTSGERSGLGLVENKSPALRATRPSGVAYHAVVRRLTPSECDVLQGFVPDYTLVPINKELDQKRKRKIRMMSDSARYKMIGNSMARPVMEWIGERIDLVRELMGEK